MSRLNRKLARRHISWSMPAALIAIALVVGFWTGSLNNLVSRDRPSVSQNTTLRLGAGNGAYLEFAQKIQEKLDSVQLKNITTDGSIDNVLRLQAREIDLAIVQSDIAHYYFYGLQGFDRFSDMYAIMPLFREFAQILVPKDSDIHVFGDLQRKSIGIGARTSGSRLHALDVLEAAGFFLDTDYVGEDVNYDDGKQLLESGDLDALFFTSSFRVQAEDSPFRHLAIPAYIIDQLNREKAYYSKVQLSDQIEGNYPQRPQLSVRAYLIARKDLPDAQIGAMVTGLVKHWDELRQYAYGVPELSEATRIEPIPFHRATEEILEAGGHIEVPPNYKWAILLGIAIFVFTLYARANQSTYDRTGGQVTHGLLSKQRTIDAIASSSMLLIILSLALVLLSGVVLSIQQFEASYAKSLNIENRFASISFLDALLWMFTFMASGFNTQDMFPESPMGQIVVAMLALFGIAAPLGAVYSGVEYTRQRKLRIRNGNQVYNKLSGHVLVCGWNDKAAGLVYSLTGDDAPYKHTVVVVAEADQEFPLERYGFDQRLVHYCRGDSADYDALRRANAHTAQVAIILAGERKVAQKNIGSVLTAIALKKENPDIFIASELLYEENLSYFEAVGTNAIVSSRLFIERIMSVVSRHEHVVEFILDALTHDQHSEVYAVECSDLQARCDFDICAMSGWDVRISLLGYGINLVGVARGGATLQGMIDADFQTDNHFSALFSDTWSDRSFSSTDKLIFLADSYETLAGKKNIKFGGYPCENNQKKPKLSLDNCPRTCVLIVGPTFQASNIQESIRSMIGVADVHIFDDIELAKQRSVSRSECDTGLVQTIEALNVATVILLKDGLADSEMTNDHAHAMDARTIVRTRMLRAGFAQERLQIITELSCIKNRRLLRDAGADVIVPGALLVERMLAKLAYSKGVVSEFLMALICTRDGLYLKDRIVEPGNPMVGLSFAEALATDRLCGLLFGWYPKRDAARLHNEQQDFDHHFYMAPGPEIAGQKIEPGDLLIYLDNDVDTPAAAMTIQ